MSELETKKDVGHEKEQQLAFDWLFFELDFDPEHAHNKRNKVSQKKVKIVKQKDCVQTQ